MLSFCSGALRNIRCSQTPGRRAGFRSHPSLLRLALPTARGKAPPYLLLVPRKLGPRDFEAIRRPSLSTGDLTPFHVLCAVGVSVLVGQFDEQISADGPASQTRPELTQLQLKACLSDWLMVERKRIKVSPNEAMIRMISRSTVRISSTSPYHVT